MNAFPDFTLGISGDGIALDPDVGTLTISAAALAAGLGFTMTTRDATGAVTDAFRITLKLSDPGTAEVAPALSRAPQLSGAGLVGQPVTLDPGAWSGTPAPELGIAWLRDGVEIPGAAGESLGDESYLPVAADDGALLSARVTARNAAGVASAETGTLAITEVAPSALGGLADLTLTKGTGAHRIETAGAFAGARLGYSVTGGGAVIDPATGALALPRDALRAGERVTVTARNSGGAAEVGFRVTVVPAIAAPEALGAIADQLYPRGEGTRTISTQAHFTGEDLVYALEAAPSGVTIQPGSGLVAIPTGAALDGTVTVRAGNAGGAATLSFRVTVRAMATVFSEAAALGEVSFLATGAAPAWTYDAQGFARLVPAATGRTHGVWTRAEGDGRYRMLVRWSTGNSTTGGNEPFLIGARIARSGADLAGVFVEAYRPVGTAKKRLRVFQYTGAGEAVTELASAVADWIWGTWYWVEVEIAGAALRARLYGETEAAPDWQITATTTVPAGTGAFGPGALPLAGVSPTVLVKRIEFSPIEPGTPAAARDADWSLAQVTEQAHD